jgi:hypothetical protein
MLSLTKKVYVEYCPLIIKMHIIFAKNEVALKNLNSLCDVEFILGLPCILLLLECLHMLIKFTPCTNVFDCDFVNDVKLTQQELFIFYCDSFSKYEDATCDNFNFLFIISNDTFPMS